LTYDQKKTSDIIYCFLPKQLFYFIRWNLLRQLQIAKGWQRLLPTILNSTLFDLFVLKDNIQN